MPLPRRASPASVARSIVFRTLTAILLLVATSIFFSETGPNATSRPSGRGTDNCSDRDTWCKRLAALKSGRAQQSLRELNKLGELSPKMCPTADTYAMRVGDHLQRMETGPLVHKEDFVRVRRQFVAAVLTYDLSARLARLHQIEANESDPTIRHRALLEIGVSIIRADDRARFPEAWAALESALRLPVPTKALHSDGHFALARLLRSAGRLHEALERLDHAIKLDGYFFHAHLERLQLILASEDILISGERDAVVNAVLATGDAVVVLEDHSYLLELEQILARHAQRRSLLRPFVEAYVSIVRNDVRAFTAAAGAFNDACQSLRGACPRSLKTKMVELGEILRRP